MTAAPWQQQAELDSDKLRNMHKFEQGICLFFLSISNLIVVNFDMHVLCIIAYFKKLLS